MIKCRNCKGRHNTVAESRECWETRVGSRTATTVATRQAPQAARVTGTVKAETIERVVPNGTYTIVFGDPSDYITIQLDEDFRNDAPLGAQMVKYLSGPDNELDFTGCAFLAADELKFWKRFRADGDLVARVTKAVSTLAGSDDDERAEAQQAYALKSGRCARCGRTLTVPASLHRGLGPVCAGIE